MQESNHQTVVQDRFDNTTGMGKVVKEMLLMELLNCLMRTQEELCQKRWKKWANYTTTTS